VKIAYIVELKKCKDICCHNLLIMYFFTV